MKANKPSPEKLYKFYITENLTAQQIAARLGCGVMTVRKWLNEYEIFKTAGVEYAVRYARFIK